MSSYESNRGLTYTAGASVRIGQIVELAADGRVVPASPGSTTILGSALDNSVETVSGDATSEIGSTISVQPLDGAKVPAIAAAAIAIATPVTVAADGQVIAATSGDPVIGFTLEAVAAAGERCPIVLQPQPGLLA